MVVVVVVVIVVVVVVVVVSFVFAPYTQFCARIILATFSRLLEQIDLDYLGPLLLKSQHLIEMRRARSQIARA